MRRFIKSILLAALLLAPAFPQAPATRTVTVTWGAVTGATGYVIQSATSSSGPFTQIGCVGTVSVTGLTCVNGSTSSTLTYQDSTPTVGSTMSYQVIASGPACTPTTPVTTACGLGAASPTGTTTIPTQLSASTTIVVVVTK